MTLASATITHLGARGDGVAGALYVPGAAPGDIVHLAADGTVVRITPGPRHATPTCTHFGTCGGCTLQHVHADDYATWLGARITMALAQHEVVAERVHPAHVSPPGHRRRAEFKCIRRGKAIIIGYAQRASHDIIDLLECPVLHSAITALLPSLRLLLAPFARERHAIAVHITHADNGLDLMIEPLAIADLATRERLIRFATDQPHEIARFSIDGPGGAEVIIEKCKPVINFGSVPVALPTRAFLQATQDAEAAMRQIVQQAVGAAARVADLFCGLGTFALPLSAGATVVAVDGAQTAITALAQAARVARRPITPNHRDLFRRPLTALELKEFDAVVIDPPRAGAEAQCHQLAASDVPLVLAVSCNPNTFARDARLLADGGYHLTDLWPIGQFLWSTHVELVACFRRP